MITQSDSLEVKETAKEGLRFNGNKLRIELVDPKAVSGIAAVLTKAAEGKYPADNWRKGLSWRATLGSLERHLNALKMGEDIDPETKLPHIDHLGCNWMFMSNFMKTGKGTDDRYKGDYHITGPTAIVTPIITPIIKLVS